MNGAPCPVFLRSQREESIEGQTAVQRVCGRSGITIVGTYIDRALSAKQITARFQRMIKDSAKRL